MESISRKYYKMTDAEGLPFYRKSPQFKLEAGVSIEEPGYDGRKECGRGLHFSQSLNGALVDGLDAAAAFHPGGLEELKRQGFKIFEVEPNLDLMVTVAPGKLKTSRLTAVREVPFSEVLTRVGHDVTLGALVPLGSALPVGFLPVLEYMRRQRDLSPFNKTMANALLQANPGHDARVQEGSTVVLDPAGDTTDMARSDFFRRFGGTSKFRVIRVNGNQTELASPDGGPAFKVPVCYLVPAGSVQGKPVVIEESSTGTLAILCDDTRVLDDPATLAKRFPVLQATVSEGCLQAVRQAGLKSPLVGLNDPRVRSPHLLIREGWRMTGEPGSNYVSYAFRGPSGEILQHLTISRDRLYLNTHRSPSDIHQLMETVEGSLVRDNFI
ncbi:MAG: hypothetical protein AB1758_20015 [Candidatus Eremiobacterota bacterium]